MVVKRPRCLEGIYESLENLLEYFSSAESKDVDLKTLKHVQSSLLVLENELRAEARYKPKRKQEV